MLWLFYLALVKLKIDFTVFENNRKIPSKLKNSHSSLKIRGEFPSIVS